MRRLPLLSAKRNKRQCEALALKVAAHSRAAGWRRLGEKIYGMSIDQARGYIRGRISDIVQREMNIAISDNPLVSQINVQDVRTRANQLLVEHLIGDLMEAKRPVSLRRAA